MPIATDPFYIAPWTRPAPTQEDLDWAPLQVIDLSIFDQPGGKQKLANDLRDSAKNVGFWVVTGYGIDDSEVLRQLSIGNAFFQQPIEEKRKNPCDFTVGNYFGYREPLRTVADTGVKENVEMLNIPKYTKNDDYKDVPKHDLIKAHEAEIAAFHRKLFDNVVRKILVLLAIILELPENYLLERHGYDNKSEDHLRYMVYHPRTLEERKLINDGTGSGHSDFGSLTLLFSQNVAGLQIRTPQGEWKWVKPVPGGITINSADVLQFLTKGYIKSTIHRVVGPPADQANIDRLGLLYFVRPNDDTPIVPVPSPVLEREGLLTAEDKEATANSQNAVNGYDWTRARVGHVHNRKTIQLVGYSTEPTFKYKGLEVVNRWA